MKMQIPHLSGIGEDQFSGRQSSKREGISRLNIGKAVAIQQEALQKTEMTLNNAKGPEINDLDEQPPQKRGMGGMAGLNLGGLGQPRDKPSDLQYSMQIGNTNVGELPP